MSVQQERKQEGEEAAAKGGSKLAEKVPTLPQSGGPAQVPLGNGTGGGQGGGQPGPAEGPQGKEHSDLKIAAGGDVIAIGSSFAKEIHNVTKIYALPPEASAASDWLSPGDFYALDREQLHASWTELQFDRATLEPMLAALEQNRLMILCGRADLGKTSQAKLLAAGLQQRAELKGAFLCTRTLDSSLRVDLEALLGKEASFHSRTLILPHAFGAGNRDLQRFASRLGAAWGSYRDRLRQSKSFLILTAETNPFASPELERLQLQCNLVPPGPELLAAALRKLANQLSLDPEGGDASAAASAACWARDHAEECASQLETFARVDRFVRELLPGVAAGRLTFVEAVDRIEDLSRWLLEDLPQDPDAWYAVLALTLCSAAPSGEPVPWLRFERLRAALERRVRRELRHERDRRELTDLCRGSGTLKRARARVQDRIAFPHPQSVQFNDGRYAGRLWDVLLGPGRPLLSLVLPLLSELSGGPEPQLAECAARALGRAGQIDPAEIIFPLLQRWTRERRHEGLGLLLQGILGSASAAYREGCLAWLRPLLLDAGAEAEAQTAVASLGYLARPAAARALDELKTVALERFELDWEGLRELAEQFRQAQEKARAEADHRKRTASLEELSDLAPVLLTWKLVPAAVQPLFGACQFAFNNILLYAPDLTLVLARLQDWMTAEPEDLGPLVALFFLGDSGVASRLRPPRPPEGTGDHGETPSSLAAEWLLDALEEQTVPHLGRLLATLFDGLRAFPGPFRTTLEESFRSLLASWAAAGRRGELPLQPLIAMLAGFLMAREPALGEEVLRMARDPGEEEEAAALRELAVAAVVGGSGERGAAAGRL